MARRSSPSRGSSAFGRGRSPSPSSRSAPRPAAPVQQKAVAPQPAPTQVAQPVAGAAPGAGMGLMANVASTAAGVAIGHTMGHALTGALMGHGGDSGSVAEQQQQPVQPQTAYQQNHPLNQQDPCRMELEQFLSCAQTQTSDLTLCDGFNQVLKECKMRYGAYQ